jgi:hypothetical protein
MRRGNKELRWVEIVNRQVKRQRKERAVKIGR